MLSQGMRPNPETPSEYSLTILVIVFQFLFRLACPATLMARMVMCSCSQAIERIAAQEEGDKSFSGPFHRVNENGGTRLVCFPPLAWL